MKKWIKILSLLICLLMLAGCAETVTYEIEEDVFLTAIWDGYDKMPFAKFLETAANDVSPELLGMKIKSARTAVFEGWDKAEVLDETTVEEGKIPVTYSLNIEYAELDNSKEIKNEEILIYAKFDDIAHTIEIIGGSSSANEESSFYSAEDTVLSLDLAKNIVQGDPSDITDMQETEQ